MRKNVLHNFSFFFFFKKLLLLVSSKLLKILKDIIHCIEHCGRICQEILLIENVLIRVLLANGRHTLCWFLKFSSPLSLRFQ